MSIYRLTTGRQSSLLLGDERVESAILITSRRLGCSVLSISLPCGVCNIIFPTFLRLTSYSHILVQI